MKSANKTASKILTRLIAGLGEDGAAKKLDSGKAYMPLHVSRLYTTKLGPVYSVAHYYEQNGDLCPDPEMEILFAIDGQFYPLALTNSFGRQVGAEVALDGSRREAPRTQRELAAFAGVFCRNIAAQQNV